MSPQDEHKLINRVNDIHAALVGNPEFKQAGLITKVEELERWRRNFDLRIAFMSGFVSTIVSGVGFLIHYIIAKATGK